MIILGIDPGTIAMGYGLIEIQPNDDVSLIDYGALTASARSPIGERLSLLYSGLQKIIVRYHPDAAAIEQPFIAKNVKSAFAIGRAQAIAILATANKGIPTYEYTPSQIKQRVANYGAGSKEQVQEMVRLQLGLSEIPEPTDASDALAVALCHLSEIKLANLLSAQERKY